MGKASSNHSLAIVCRKRPSGSESASIRKRPAGASETSQICKRPASSAVASVVSSAAPSNGLVTMQSSSTIEHVSLKPVGCKGSTAECAITETEGPTPVVTTADYILLNMKTMFDFKTYTVLHVDDSMYSTPYASRAVLYDPNNLIEGIHWTSGSKGERPVLKLTCSWNHYELEFDDGTILAAEYVRQWAERIPRSVKEMTDDSSDEESCTV